MNKNNPLVSVAIITYNQKYFLMQCINSILEQDYKNIEIVVADDCSSDGTQEMLLDYQSKYPDLFVLRLAKLNQGITMNSNSAYFACSGKYIAWMGGDDLMMPKKLAKQVAFMEANLKCDICYHNLEVFQSETNVLLYFMNSKNKFEGNVDVMISKGCFNGACATMVRASKCPKSGFDIRIPVASDWLFWVETLGNGGEIMYIDEVLGKYRRHVDNITNSTNYKTVTDHLNSCNIMLTTFPNLHNIILNRYSEILRSMRYKNALHYIYWLKSSIKVGLNFKSIIIYYVYILSFKWLKK